MKAIYPLLLSCLLISCKSPFLQRRYMPGAFSEKHHDLVSPEKAQQKRPPLVKNELAAHPDSGRKTVCADTIFLRNNSKLACKASLITETEVHFLRRVREKESRHCLPVDQIARIRFQNGVTECFPNRQARPASEPARYPAAASANSYAPKAQSSGKQDKSPVQNGFALFGYIGIMITGILTLLVAPAIGIAFLGTAVVGFVFLNEQKDTKAYKVFRAIGIFIGSLITAFFVIGILAVVILIALL